MGKPDESYYNYLDDNRRFADQINGALFHGEQVVKPDELEPGDAQLVYLGKEAGKRENFKVIVDKARIWKGRMIHILFVEHQSYVDYRMVLRNMLSESLSYNKQWENKRTFHENAKDLKFGTDEFFSGMKKEEKFMPVITLVVYCGIDHPWDGARCLYDLLDIDEQTKRFVTNYRINMYDCHEHATFDEYCTGLRQLFEAVRYGKDKAQMKRIMEENKEAYNNIDSDTREVLEVIAKVRIPEEYKVVKNGETRFEMCKAFEDYRLEGKFEGMQEHLVRAVCKKLQKNKSVDVIADELEEEIQEIEKVIKAQQKVGSYDVEQIRMELDRRK